MSDETNQQETQKKGNRRIVTGDMVKKFARALAHGQTANQASLLVGINPQTGYEWAKREDIIALRAAEEKRMAGEDAKAAKKFDISREKLLARALAIAETPAEETKGSNATQLAAVQWIYECLGYSKEAPENPGEEATVYRPKWMDKPIQGGAPN